jgi:hypothetical protein
MRAAPRARYSPKLTDSPVRSLAPPSKYTGSWGQDCWRASRAVPAARARATKRSRSYPARCKQALNRRKRRQRRARAEPEAAARQGTEKSGSSRQRPTAFAPGADDRKRLKRYHFFKSLQRRHEFDRILDEGRINPSGRTSLNRHLPAEVPKDLLHFWRQDLERLANAICAI